MVEALKPVDCVKCPVTGLYVPTDVCATNECGKFLELRRPWRHYAVKCDPFPKDFNSEDEDS